MIELRAGIAAHIAFVMSADLGFSPGACGMALKAVLEWSEADLGRLWILKLEEFGWTAVDLRSYPEADEFDPDGHFVGGENVVSHRNIGEWMRDCRKQAGVERATPN